jgi:hypothetical protein
MTIAVKGAREWFVKTASGKAHLVWSSRGGAVAAMAACGERAKKTSDWVDATEHDTKCQKCLKVEAADKNIASAFRSEELPPLPEGFKMTRLKKKKKVSKLKMVEEGVKAHSKNIRTDFKFNFLQATEELEPIAWVPLSDLKAIRSMWEKFTPSSLKVLEQQLHNTVLERLDALIKETEDREQRQSTYMSTWTCPKED